MPKRKTVDELLADLDALEDERDADRRVAGLKAALARRHYRVVARAAKLSEDGLCYALVPDLLSAYQRFLDDPAKRDPNCHAKKAIARALVNLECDDAAFYQAGLRYRQLEPVWGGSVDTAIDVRASCATGLVACGYPRALVELTELLCDPEPGARAGAVRAIACGNPQQAEMLLRFKARGGDADAAVIGDCLSGLLAVEPEESPAFVAGFLSHEDPEVCELAAFALGESRLDAALDYLKAAWEEVWMRPALRGVLIRAAALHRSDAALCWLLAQIEPSRPETAREIIEALSIYRRNARVTAQVEAAVVGAGLPELHQVFAKLWREPE